MTETTADVDWQAWQTSWDRQQEWYMPDREERFRVMLDTVEALVGPEPKVLDLACGTGSITARVLRRFPGARTTGVDLDPVLLTIARGTFAADERAAFVSADLRDPAWTGALPHRSYDVVLTATALHWLDAEPLRSLYGQLTGVLREGGAFLNADHMEDDSAPRINAAVRAFHDARKERERASGTQDWGTWWSAVADDPALAELASQRFELFNDPRSDTGDNVRPTRPTTTRWHADALREQGFAEARQVWCSASDALMVALR